MRHALWLGVLMTTAMPLPAETIRIEADRDATLIEDREGALANGSGPFFFAGRTNQAEESIRRALLRFDVAGSLPPGAVIEKAAVILFAAPGNPVPRTLSLHRVLSDWSEGPSFASGGGGAPSLAEDATWIHTCYHTDLWRRPGGDFIEPPSASLEVADTGTFTWEGPRLRTDVQLWAAAPQRNFGWALLGDETVPQSSRSFASREHGDAGLRPVLEITFREPAHPPSE